MRRIVAVEGMSCAHCAQHVRKALEEVSGVSKAEVDLQKAQAVVEGDGFTDEQLRAAVNDAGYTAVRVSS